MSFTGKFKIGLKYKKLSVVFFVLMISLSLFFLSFEQKEADRFEIVKNLDIFTSLFKEVNSLYVDETLPGELMNSGIEGMLNSLDPYTTFYPESEIEDYKIMTTGQYGGIGARIKNIKEKAVVDEIFENSPAMKTGLKTGDIIIKVDGKEITEKLAQDLSKLLKGTPGTDVEITVERPGLLNPLVFNFKREEIKISSVPFYGMINNEVGYIKMSSFTKQVSEEVKEAFLDLKKNKNMKKLIFDLRGNPGGLLFESINIVNFFTKKDEKVVETRGKIKDWTKVYKNINQPIDLEMPIVVLVDEGSASASEIVSGSLQDMDRAIILGNNTYGKGLVQTTVKLKYNTSLKITTAKYYIPSGRCIQEIDYSKKDSYGKGKKTPDSLFVNFKTKNGRNVKDGHGIQPDFIVEKKQKNPVVNTLIKDNYIFNFITNHLLSNKTIVDIDKVEISDLLFQEFMDYLIINKYNHITETESKLIELEKSAESEKLLNQINIKLIDIKNTLNENKLKEISNNKTEIKEALKQEIILRYYYQKGKIQISLKSDTYVLEALNLLNNPTLYNSYIIR